LNAFQFASFWATSSTFIAKNIWFVVLEPNKTITWLCLEVNLVNMRIAICLDIFYFKVYTCLHPLKKSLIALLTFYLCWSRAFCSIMQLPNSGHTCHSSECGKLMLRATSKGLTRPVCLLGIRRIWTLWASNLPNSASLIWHPIAKESWAHVIALSSILIWKKISIKCNNQDYKDDYQISIIP
jgi:hypothetical protein